MANLTNTIIDDTGFLKYPVGTTAQRPVSPATGMTRYNTDLGCLETYNGASWVSAIVTETAEPNIVAFTAGSHTFTVPQHVNELEVLVVAGGGAGGGRSGGGGGAGGLVYSYNYPVRPGDTIPLTIGEGGNPVNNNVGNSGANSTFGPITANGGGRGGNDSPATGDPGGSGGGTHYGVYGQSTATQSSYAPVNAAGYGNRGAVGYHAPQHNSGGGGGAGGVPPGGSGTSNALPTTVSGGHGGSGRYYESFTKFGRSAGWFAGGGAGGGHPDGPVNNSMGGRGGGGDCLSPVGYPTQFRTMNGQVNTGGGGAAVQQENAGDSGKGGPGVVLIRY